MAETRLLVTERVVDGLGVAGLAALPAVHKMGGLTLSHTTLGGFPGHPKLEQRLYPKKAVPWKGKPEEVAKRPELVEALNEYAIPASKGASFEAVGGEALGTAIDKETGKLVPRKVLKQRQIAKKKYTPIEMLRRRREKARVYHVPIEKLKAPPPAPPAVPPARLVP